MKYSKSLPFLLAFGNLAYAFNTSDSAEIIRSESCGNLTDAVPFYRSYNSAQIDHWYTPDVAQINVFDCGGWVLQGVTGLAFVTQAPGTTPFFRVWNGAVGDNFYTTSTAERDAALRNGYVVDATSVPVTYIYPNQICGSKPLFRLFSSSGQDNFYTTSQAERVDFVANRGYADVSIAGYVLPLGCGPWLELGTLYACFAAP